MFEKAYLAVWGTGNTCFVPTSCPHCRSSPPGWSEREAGCCCTKTSGQIIRNTWGVLALWRKLTACLGVVSWKQRPLGLCRVGRGRGPVFWGGLPSAWSTGWMTTDVSGVWWTRTFISTENNPRTWIDSKWLLTAHFILTPGCRVFFVCDGTFRGMVARLGEG